MSRVIEGKLPCPNCTSSDAYHLYDDGHGYCYSCQYYHPPEGYDRLVEYTYEYLTRRGLTPETLRFYGIKTKIDPEGKPVSVGYPYPWGAYKVRNLDHKEFYWKGEHKPGLFATNLFAAGSHKYVTITEGEDDAASLWQVLKSPCVSVQSSGTAARDCSVDRDFLASFERIYLAMDADGPGREAAQSVARLFDYNRVYQVKFTNRKDANDYLQVGEGQELTNIWWNARKYLPENIVSSFADLRKILHETTPLSVPYPWATLNDMTYGIRRGESVLITAQEGVGKTELMHAIEHKLLRDTDECVGSIFLEEPKRRHLQALASLERQSPIHLPDYAISDEETAGILEALIRVDERYHLYSHFGSDDPGVILDTIRFLVTSRNVVFLLLDHITMVCSGLSGEDERRALDYVSTRLEMMVKELNFALIVVSHVNDLGQTRGSRYIGKVVDTRIDATRALLDPDDDIRNTTYLTISKNRFCGRTGPAGILRYDQRTGTYRELSDVGHLSRERFSPVNDNTPDSERRKMVA